MSQGADGWRQEFVRSERRRSTRSRRRGTSSGQVLGAEERLVNSTKVTFLVCTRVHK